MTTTHNLGFPRIGRQRELKHALESFWAGNMDLPALQACGQQLRARHWLAQAQAGIDLIPVGDFAWYDQMLNMLALLGCAPARFGFGSTLTLTDYFQLARGNTAQFAMEMTKWFDTNYHYLVPELNEQSSFRIGTPWLFEEVAEAQALGIRPKPVLIGPLTFLWLSKYKSAPATHRDDCCASHPQPELHADRRLALLDSLIPVYCQILARLADQGVEWVQIDEPALVLDLPQNWLEALAPAYARLHGNGPKLLLASYFGSVGGHAPALAALPVEGLHIDLVRAPEQLDAVLRIWPQGKVLSLGLVDGRNIWRNDLDHSLSLLERAASLGEYLWVAPSCSLLHAPVDLAQEDSIDPELRSWLAFAPQKLEEIVTLGKGLAHGRSTITAELAASQAVRDSRQNSIRTRNPAVRARTAALPGNADQRSSPFVSRIVRQQAALSLPALPTTTIGSFPQTATIRQARAAFKRKAITSAQYLAAMQTEIALAVRKQEEIGLDVLVHGEAERNDMVEYFGEQLAGFAFTQFGWVQSYGSRCVKPPIIYGDVSRPAPMTVAWTRYAQSLTDKPMKGMLTGPVTILQWSFVRDDQPRADTALQIALAVRDEVVDLEAAGIKLIQIDEPAFREGLPLKRAQWQDYLDWAGRAFRIAACGVQDRTQIHTHMCYAEFNDILPAIAAMDADVITIETSRSDMELLDGFGAFNYPNDIGPGVYDIHSPRIPQVNEMLRLLDKARAVIPVERLWVNPDCGLKTRGWPETEAALRNMVAATWQLRAKLAAPAQS